jgi:hypothetical protein
MDEIKKGVYMPDDLSKKAGVEDFDRWFYGNITVRIQKWRGGYTHIEVEYPFCRSEKPESIKFYGGRDGASLWRFDLPSRPEEFTSAQVQLESDGHCVMLSATAGRFGWRGMTDNSPAPDNVFLTAPLDEGPTAEPYFKPDRRIEIWPDVYRYLEPWERCYQHLDLQRGLGWNLWIEDCDLLSRSQGNSTEARRLLLEEWRENFAWNDAGKEWYERVAKMIEDVHKKEMAELMKHRAFKPPLMEAIGPLHTP